MMSIKKCGGDAGIASFFSHMDATAPGYAFIGMIKLVNKSYMI